MGMETSSDICFPSYMLSRLVAHSSFVVVAFGRRVRECVRRVAGVGGSPEASEGSGTVRRRAPIAGRGGDHCEDQPHAEEGHGGYNLGSVASGGGGRLGQQRLPLVVVGAAHGWGARRGSWRIEVWGGEKRKRRLARLVFGSCVRATVPWCFERARGRKVSF